MEGKIFRLGPAAGGKGMLPKLVALVVLLTGVLTLTVVATPPPPPRLLRRRWQSRITMSTTMG